MEIRKFTAEDRETFLSLSRAFYATDSVAAPISEANMQAAFDEIVGGSPYIDGFLLWEEGRPAGYGLVIYTYSMECGGRIAILDELYLLPDFQRRGLGGAYLQRICDHLPQDLRALRLEFVPEKEHLRRLYEENGFELMKYASMIRVLD